MAKIRYPEASDSIPCQGGFARYVTAKKTAVGITMLAGGSADLVETFGPI
jgi:hypothetical protein